MGFLPANFQLATPIHSRLKDQARDRRMERLADNSHQCMGWGHNALMHTICTCNKELVVLSNELPLTRLSLGMESG